MTRTNLPKHSVWPTASRIHSAPGRLFKRHGNRLLVCNPPALPLAEAEMDAIYALPFEKAPHPSYREPIPAWEQIKTSITSHRGCFGGCAFCAIAMHQGKTIQSRSEASILAEIRRIDPKSPGSVAASATSAARLPTCTVSPAAIPKRSATCRRASCIFPAVCKHLRPVTSGRSPCCARPRGLAGVKHVAVSSGVRYDLMERQPAYFRELVGTSCQRPAQGCAGASCGACHRTDAQTGQEGLRRLSAAFPGGK